MNAAARRSRRRQGWPRGLYEPRPGYYVYRARDGQVYVIGRVELDVAIAEAAAANLHELDASPALVERMTGAHHTLADVIAKMPAARTKATAVAYGSWDKLITAGVGHKACHALTVADCAALVEGIHASGREHTAKQVRSRLIMVCKRAMQLGWMDVNPAAVTGAPQAEVKRGRLTMDTFWRIHERAGEVAEWLPHAMLLALVTGQDRSTVCAMERSHVRDGHLLVWRGKTRRTNRPVEIPLTLRLDAAGVSLAELVARKTGVISKHLVHHTAHHGTTPAGSPVQPDAVSAAFTAARKLAKVGGANPPTFHEIRSLAKREYQKQGNVDTKQLLGHSSDSAAAVYEDPRGIEPIRVRVGAQVNKS